MPRLSARHEATGTPARRRSPFGPTAPSVTAALGYGLACLVWVAAGDALPGGRWLAVHLFTLGVLTNLVLTFSEHFGRTLTRQPDRQVRWPPVALNLGVLAVLVGLPTGAVWLVGLGATVATAVVLVAGARLRRMRGAAVGARFVWVVRMYERAHGAFVHGAVLGLLLGSGLLPGSWYLAGRTAHLHVNVLGWAGSTLLATLVFFGPTVVRTRIVTGADDRAARAQRHGATGLTIGVLLLLASGVGGVPGTALRVTGAAGLAVYAWAATVTCSDVVEAARRAKPSPTRWPLVAGCSWLPVAVWTDVVVVATGSWRWLDAVGLAVLVGVLAQVVLVVLAHLAPMLRVPQAAGRHDLRARLAVAGGARTVAYNVGVAGMVLAAVVRGDLGAVLARGGWSLVLLATAALGTAALAPVRVSDTEAG